jgi:hypothetical protein
VGFCLRKACETLAIRPNSRVHCIMSWRSASSRA